ncbi:MAG: DUF1302 domain-containing protein [Pseudoxanthomonas sp.]
MESITKRDRAHRRTLGVAVAAAMAGMCASAGAAEIKTGNEDLKIRFENTIRYNVGVRLEDQSQGLIGNPNFDDGDRNFVKGDIITNRLDLLSEFDLVYRDKWGLRVSAAGWYDFAYDGKFNGDSVATSNHLENGVPAIGLSNYAERYYKGPSGEILDAFVFGRFNMGEVPVTVRAGRHTVNWGEGLLSGGATHGVGYAQTPMDLAKALATPGVEAKELFLPLTQISAQLQATPTLSFAAQYFFEWESTRVPESGTYLGFADHYMHGGESLVLAPGVPGVRALRGADIAPKDSGDWGVAMRWSPEWLDGTMGFYVRNFTDKTPQAVLLATTRQYFLDWASDVDLYGVSLTKQIGGISFGTDLNYRKNMPLNSETPAVLSAAALPARGEILGARGETVHLVVNAVGIISSNALFDAASWNAEVTWSRWLDVTQGERYFKGRPAYTAIDRVDKNSAAIALNFAPSWYQVFNGADLSIPISYSIGFLGNSSVSSGGNKDAGNYSIGLALDYLSKYRFDLKYVDYFGKTTTNAAGVITVANGTTPLLADRGGVFFTFKTTF